MRILLLVLLCTLAAFAQFEPLDAKLSGYSYPFEVKFHRFKSQRQDLQMAYMDVNPERGGGKTILLLHGKNFSGAYWEETIKALSKEGHRVLVPDQIGFGKSSKPDQYQFTLAGLATNTRDLMDALAVDQVQIVGHSMGGMLGVRMALMFPGRVEKLVLVNPIGLEDYQKLGVPYRSVDENFALELKSTPESIKKYMRESYFSGLWKTIYDPLLTIQAGWAVGPDKETMAYLSALTSDMIFTQPVVHGLPLLKMPTLLIIGQRDRTAIGKAWAPPEVRDRLGKYPELGKATAKAIPKGQLVEIEDAGHMPQVDQFELYFEALKDFLG